MAKRVLLLCITIICTICLSFCAAQPESNNKSIQDHSFEPYQKITCESELTLSPDQIKSFNEVLRENLIGLNGLSEERADQLIQNGKFECRYIEAGNVITNDKINWRYIASANVTVWKSEDYFAVCSTDEASFTPYINEQMVEMIGSNAWSDAEEGFLKPLDKSETIVVVVGRAGYLKVNEISNAPSELYLEKVDITY